MAKTDILRVYIWVPQNFYPYTHEGLPVDILVSELPGQKFSGTITHLAGGLDPTSRTLQAEVRIPNKDSRLLPGMYVQVRVSAHLDSTPLNIPSSALVVRNDGTFVIVVDKNNLAHYRKVVIGKDDGHQLTISDGLTINETIAVDPPLDLKESEQILPRFKTEGS